MPETCHECAKLRKLRIPVKRLFTLFREFPSKDEMGSGMSLAQKLAAERRGRLAAERLLELKQAELFAANRKLGLHARALSEEIVETRAEVASVRDENRRVKSDLTVAHQKVEIAERRLWHSIQTIQDGFAFFDTDDRLIAANDAYMVVFDGLDEVKPGIAYAQILQFLTEEGIVDTGDMTSAEWRRSMLRRRQMTEPEPVVIRLWNDQYVKVVDHRGASGDLISLGLNITSTVRYERDLKEARERAEAAARAKSAFLANMSHEIRTPMNGVVGMAELMLDTSLDEEQRLYAETIRNSGEALLVIINDVLDYSKIEAEKLVLHMGTFDLEKSIHEVLMLLQPAAREKDVSLILDYDMFLPHLLIGDVGRIRQILTNLIGNAVKFTPSGHVLVRVTGAPERDGDRLMVHVLIEDTGIGIEEDKLDQIFSEFTQVEDESNRKFEGTGLGLSISKRLVGLMEGEIWASSEIGVGSNFGFKIPLEVGAEPPQLPVTLPQTLRKVLIVDHNQTNRELLYKQMELLQVEADALATGEEALREIDASHDLVIIDHHLPEMDGLTLVRQIRAAGHETPVVMLTENPGGLGNDEDGSQVSAVLTLPLPRDRLVTALQELGTSVPAPTEAAESAEPGGTATEEVVEREVAEPVPTHPVPAEPVPAQPMPAEPAPDAPETPAVAAEETPQVATDAEPATQPSVQPSVQPTVQSDVDEAPAAPSGAKPMFRARQRQHQPAPRPAAPDAGAASGSTTATVPDGAPADPVEPGTVKAPHRATSTPTPVQPAPVQSPPVQNTPGTAPGGPRLMRILAAEDNKTNQLVFRKMVKDLEIDLRIANDGVEAVAAYQEFEPDMIFMDISMPQMDGKEATGAIRKLESETGRHVPIVALTAHAMDGDDLGILAAGLDHYLTKPLRKPAIQDMIRQLVPEDVADPFKADAA